MILKPHLLINIFLLGLALNLLWPVSAYSQQLMKSGNFDDFTYRFKGSEHYKTKNGLVFAMAHTASRDVSEVEASIRYHSNFKIIKKDGQGFETIIHLYPADVSGQTNLLGFDFSHEILPRIKSLKLTFSKGPEFIYVKSFELHDSLTNNIFLTFSHQRFAPEWKIKLEVEKWDFAFDDAKFQQKWLWVNEYQMAGEWLNRQEKLPTPSTPEMALIHKIRYLQWFSELENLPFYQQLIIKSSLDLLELEKKINVKKFILQKEIEAIEGSELFFRNPVEARQLAEVYFQIETDLLGFSTSSTNLFGDLYFSFNANSASYLCLHHVHKILNLTGIANAIETFDYEIQRQSIALISQLMAEKKPREALFQMERLSTFYENSGYLTQTSTFTHFKARAVYDIYLSYIEVSRQAIEKNRFEMAEKYLEQATDIQKNYPSEIINDLYAEKEKHQLVKKALQRYQKLIEQGQHEQAERVIKGIKGLMKKLGITHNQSPLNES